MSNDIAEKILAELKSLRQEVAFLTPTETLEEYENSDEISTALHEARSQM